jgi:hypothetical protein
VSGLRRTIWQRHSSFDFLITFLVAVVNAEDRFAGIVVSFEDAGATLAHSAVAFFGNRCQDLWFLPRCESRTLHWSHL